MKEKRKNMKLIEWSTHYIKFKDCMKKNIIELNIKDSTIQVKEKNKEIEYLICEDLSKSISQLKETKQTIITLNTKENLDLLIKEWKTFIKYKQLTIIFSNPIINETWNVHPKTHQEIIEEKHLKNSLLALFNNVTTI